jgi:DNA-directed RNA polymerase beta' subunit
MEYLDPENRGIDIDGNVYKKHGRSFSYKELYNNFEEIMGDILDCEENLFNLIIENKDKFFVRSIYVLPLEMRYGEIIKTNNSFSIQLDKINSKYLEIINHINNIQELITNIDNENIIEIELYTLQELLCGSSQEKKVNNPNKYEIGLQNLIIDNIEGKEGVIRNNILSNRINFSARAPIVLMEDEHHPFDIIVYRNIFLEVFKFEIIAFLSRVLNINFYDAENYYHLHLFDEDDVFINEAIKWRIDQGCHFLINRNPSLQHNNILYCRVIDVCKDSVIKVNKMILPSMAGDIDGDTMALFELQFEESINHAIRNYSLASLVKDPYNGGKYGKHWIAPYQDNNLGLWLLNPENYRKVVGE